MSAHADPNAAGLKMVNNIAKALDAQEKPLYIEYMSLVQRNNRNEERIENLLDLAKSCKEKLDEVLAREAQTNTLMARILK